MPGEIYANTPSTTVTSGGTGNPPTETWTVASSAGFPAASNSAALPTQFHVSDPVLPSELMAVTNVSGTSWSVTRGAEGTTAVPHAAGFTVRQVVSANALLQLRDRIGWYNVVTQFGADPTGAADSTTAIQNAVNACAGAGVVYIPAGTYRLSSALAVGSGITIRGDGANATILDQYTTTANGITISGTTVTNVQILDLRINGFGTGTGVGISATADAGANPVIQLVLRNLYIYSMGSHGVYVLVPIVSTFDNVEAAVCGGRGFYITGVSATTTPGTSCTFLSCYANTCALDGWYINMMTYSTFIACASDSCATGYVVLGCQTLLFNGCGAESTVAKNSLDGTGFKITVDASSNLSSEITLNTCFVFASNAVGIWVTGGSTDVVITAPAEISPGGSATASIKTDTGTMSTIIGYSVVTALALTSNTYNLLNDGHTGEWTVAGTGYLSAANFYGLASHTQGTSTAGTAAVTSASFTTAVAKQLDTAQDVILYINVTTAILLGVSLSATNSAGTTLVAHSGTVTEGLLSIRVPMGWYVMVTCATMADLTCNYVPC